jgi:hypothetical protein
MEVDEVLSLLDVPFTFSRRPVAISGEMRPLWRMALITLFLDISSRGAKSSLTRLHALNWLSKTPRSRDQLIKILEREHSDGTPIIRYEPSFNRALDLAVGENLIARYDGNRFALTLKGRRFSKEIESEESCLNHEKEFLRKVGKRFTESISSELTESGVLA